jgi:hypothetical protein
MSREQKRFVSGAALTVGLTALGLVFLLHPPSVARAQDELPAGSSWAQFRAELERKLPARIEEVKTRIQRMRLVRRPKSSLSSYDDDPALWNSITGFYDYIKGRELDVYYEQPGIPDFFPDRGAYYDFLDTILPAMRERKFERNRILEYEVHEIAKVEGEPGQAEVLISVTSDDILPFGKIMICRQRWIRSPRGWYPGKISADIATYWERIR